MFKKNPLISNKWDSFSGKPPAPPTSSGISLDYLTILHAWALRTTALSLGDKGYTRDSLLFAYEK